MIARREKRFFQSQVGASSLPSDLDQADEETLGQWFAVVASQWGLEVEPVQATYAEVSQLVRGAGPALFRLPASVCRGESRFLIPLRVRWGWLSLIGPDLAIHHVRPGVVRDALCDEIEAPHVASIDQLLTTIRVPEHRHVRARQAILDEQIGPIPVRGCWFVRLSPSVSLQRQAPEMHLLRALLTFMSAFLMQLTLTLVAWWLIGQSAVAGYFDWGWLLAWALLLFTTGPFQALGIIAGRRFATGVGGLFKLRLLYGTLQLEPEEVRHQGVGQFLGRVMESEAVQQLALGGGFEGILALLQLAIAMVVLTLGAGGWPHTLLLLLWVAVTLGFAWGYLQRGHVWADAYRELTNDLVERMVGHRTRLVQEDRTHWHDEEDQVLEHYVHRSEQLDRLGAYMQALVPRGWMVLGLAGFSYALLVGRGSPAQLAISLGGILLALQALTQLVPGLQNLISAAISWKQVSPLFQAAARTTAAPSVPAFALAERREPVVSGMPVITVRELRFRYRGQGRQVLQECNLQIQQGDRLLLEGPSGGGKSTFAALLAGLRAPESGLLLLWGYDRHSLGAAAWRRQVIAVPQFHENHVFTGTLAFNLLMGRRWPPLPEDLEAAETICRELGLGDLLDRMPAGMQQVVGDSGWRLSHGECSRLYIARALLQQADVMILDESFGALDPDNLQRSLRCVLQRASTLMVIAHP